MSDYDVDVLDILIGISAVIKIISPSFSIFISRKYIHFLFKKVLK
jgi:hypothetical protein